MSEEAAFHAVAAGAVPSTRICVVKVDCACGREGVGAG
jgi:hypothetical protein